MLYFGNAKNAGIIVGAKAPIILVSRSDGTGRPMAFAAPAKLRPTPRYLVGLHGVRSFTSFSLYLLPSGWSQFGVDDLRLKAADTFGPIGPCIETELDPFDTRIRSWVNGLCNLPLSQVP